MSPALLALALAAHPAGLTPPPAADSNPAVSTAAEEQVLKAAGLPVSDAGLLDFFRRRTYPPADKAHVAALVKRLADRSAARDQAAAELVGIGHPAVPLLRQAANNADDEDTAARARRCLDAIEGPGASGLAQAAARLVAARKPAGAVPVLLAYVPFADDDAVVSEIEGALRAAGLRDGKVEAPLVPALQDEVPIRRCVAARVLSRIGGSAERAAVRVLLKDPRPTVRLQAALGLAGAYEAEAVPVLIDLLAELPPDGRKQAEDFLTQLAGEWAVAGPPGNDRLSGRLRRDAWEAWWRGIDGASLLDELRSRTLSDGDRVRVLDLIRGLDDPSPQARDRAAAELTGFGPRAAPLLRQAAGQGHPRIGPLAAQCLEAVEPDGPRPLPTAAPRLLALRRPGGTLEALLGYLPFADSEAVAAEIVDLLAALGCPDRRPAPELLRALDDPVPARRAAAAAALCLAAAEGQLPAVRKLLQDPDAEVRLRAALALASRADRGAVPVLITLLGELPLDQAWEAEDFLLRLAGEQAPAAAVEGEPAARAACVGAWKKWWREQGGAVDLARGDGSPREGGLLLVVEQQGPRGTGRVLELTAAGKTRWQVEGLQYPWDAELLPRGTLLVLEQGNRLTERDRQGKVLWQRVVPNAVTCQRLRNGQTFVVCRNQLLIFDREGKEVFNHVYGGGWIMGGRRFRDGHMAFVTYQGSYVRLDAAGKQVKTFHVPFNMNFGVAGAEVLPGDRVLVALPNPGKVIEFAPEGKVAWEASVPAPGYPTRLANGRTLVPSHNNTALTELDRTGRVVAEKKDLPCHPFRVYPR
jgi:HEAT repeat protein